MTSTVREDPIMGGFKFTRARAIIKMNYTGDIRTFKKVVEGCHISVIIAGDQKAENTKEVLQTAYNSIKACGSGLSLGRNVFQHKDPTLMVKALSAIVHHGASVEKALEILGGPE